MNTFELSVLRGVSTVWRNVVENSRGCDWRVKCERRGILPENSNDVVGLTADAVQAEVCRRRPEYDRVGWGLGL